MDLGRRKVKPTLETPGLGPWVGLPQAPKNPQVLAQLTVAREKAWAQHPWPNVHQLPKLSLV